MADQPQGYFEYVRNFLPAVTEIQAIKQGKYREFPRFSLGIPHSTQASVQLPNLIELFVFLEKFLEILKIKFDLIGDPVVVVNGPVFVAHFMKNNIILIRWGIPVCRKFGIPHPGSLFAVMDDGISGKGIDVG
jgi:hypothetical protein